MESLEYSFLMLFKLMPTSSESFLGVFHGVLMNWKECLWKKKEKLTEPSTWKWICGFLEWTPVLKTMYYYSLKSYITARLVNLHLSKAVFPATLGFYSLASEHCSLLEQSFGLEMEFCLGIQSLKSVQI